LPDRPITPKVGSITEEELMCLNLINQAPRHEDVWWNGGTAPYSLTSALDGGECSASRPCRFSHGKIPGIHFIGGWAGLRACLDAVEKRIPFPLRGI
jgi:hypothetical protein